MSKTQEILAALTVEEQIEAMKRAAIIVDTIPGNTSISELVNTLALRCARLEVAMEKKA